MAKFGGKKAAPFISAKKSPGKFPTKRKKSSTKTAKGLKKVPKKASGGSNFGARMAAARAKKGKSGK